MTDTNKTLQEYVREDKLTIVESASGKQTLYKESANTNDKLLLYVAEDAQQMKNYFRTRNVGVMPDVVAEDKLDEFRITPKIDPSNPKNELGAVRRRSMDKQSELINSDEPRDERHNQRVNALGRVNYFVSDLSDVNKAREASENNAVGNIRDFSSQQAELRAALHSNPKEDFLPGAKKVMHQIFIDPTYGTEAEKSLKRNLNYTRNQSEVDRFRTRAESTEVSTDNRLEEASMFQGGPDNSTTGNPGMDYRTYLAAELFGSTSFASQVPTADTHQEQAVIQGTQAAEGMGVLRPSGAPANNMYEHSISNQLIKLTKNLFRAGKIQEAAKIADAIEQPENAAASVLEAAMATDGKVDAELTEDLYQTAAILNNIQEG